MSFSVFAANDNLYFTPSLTIMTRMGQLELAAKNLSTADQEIERGLQIRQVAMRKTLFPPEQPSIADAAAALAKCSKS
jgi:hypothetical protein